MATISRRKQLIIPIAPVGGVAAGCTLAVLAGVMPAGMLEQAVVASGLPSVLTVAEPPLGLTARFLLILVGGGLATIFGWLVFFVMLGGRALAIGRRPVADAEDDVPVLIRADAHPDAPARRPLFANSDLGTPFLDVHAPEEEYLEDDLLAGVDEDWEPLPLPEDLDQPLAAFDPGAIRDEPLQPAQSVTPLAKPRPQLFEDGERFETFNLIPPARITPVAPPRPRDRSGERPDTQATISALLERLERGVAQLPAAEPARILLEPPPPLPAPIAGPETADQPESLARTIEALRRMAANVG